MSAATERRPSRPRRPTTDSTEGAAHHLDSYSYVYAVPDDAISPWLKCAICLNPFVDPHVSRNCQHTFCLNCIAQHLEREQTSLGRSASPAPSTSSAAAASRPIYGPCPECRTPVSLANFRPAALLVRNMVDALLVRCPNAQRGCPKVVERSLLAGHRSECGWGLVGEEEARAHEKGDIDVIVSATRGKGKARTSDSPPSSSRRCMCGAKVLRKDWEEHQRGGSCTVPWVECRGQHEQEGCGTMLSAEHFEAHLQSCPAALMECDHCGGATRRSELSSHLEDCPDQPIDCVNATFGCPWTGPRKELGWRPSEKGKTSSGHLATCPLALVAPFLARQQAAQEALVRENRELKSRMLQLEGRTDESERQTRACVDSLGAWFVPRDEDEDVDLAEDEEGRADPVAGEADRGIRAPNLRRASTSTSRWVRATQVHEPSPSGRPSSTSRPSSIPAPQAVPAPNGARMSPGVGLSTSAASQSRSAPGAASDTLDHWPWDEMERQSESRSAQEGRPRALSSLGARSVGSASAVGAAATGLRLGTTLSTIEATLTALSKRLDAIEVRVEESSRVAAQGASEASRALDECGTARHALHGMRMQLHQVVLHQHHQQAQAQQQQQQQQQQAGQQQRRQRGDGAGEGSSSAAAAAGVSGAAGGQDHGLLGPILPPSNLLGPDGLTPGGGGGWGMTPPLPLLYGHGGPNLKAHPHAHHAHHPMAPQGPHPPPPPPLVGLRRWGIEQVRL